MFYSKFSKAIQKNSKSLKSILKVLLVSVIFFYLFIYCYNIGSIVEGRRNRRRRRRNRFKPIKIFRPITIKKKKKTPTRTSKGEKKKKDIKTAEVTAWLSAELAETLVNGGTIGSGNNTYSGDLPLTYVGAKDPPQKLKDALQDRWDYYKFKMQDGTKRPSDITTHMNEDFTQHVYLWGLDRYKNYGKNTNSLLHRTLTKYNQLKQQKQQQLQQQQVKNVRETSEKNLEDAILLATKATNTTNINALDTAEEMLEKYIEEDEDNVGKYGQNAAANNPNKSQAVIKKNQVVKEIKNLKEQQRIAAEEKKFGKTQKAIKDAIISSKKRGMLKNCAIPYSESLQLQFNDGLLNIFNTDNIYQCVGGEPKPIQAKTAGELPDGIILINENRKRKGKNDHMSYNDTIKMCNKRYTMKKNGQDSDHKITYGDKIEFIPNGWNGGSFSATVNPNIYGLDNVKDMKSDDFSAYFSEYTYCRNSSIDPEITATTNTN